MAYNLNKIILIGRVGRKEEMMVGESKCTKISLVTSDNWKDKNNEWHERAHWHNLFVSFPSLQKNFEGIDKGDVIYIEGKLEYHRYETKDGEKKEATQILVSAVNMVFKYKPKDNAQQGNTPKQKLSTPEYSYGDEAEDDGMPF